VSILTGFPDLHFRVKDGSGAPPQSLGGTKQSAGSGNEQPDAMLFRSRPESRDGTRWGNAQENSRHLIL